VSDRVSQTILLCEDDAHSSLVIAYLRQCGLNTNPPCVRIRNASREVRGGNIAWVLQEFPKELHACRKRHATHARTLLIVVADADNFSVDDRRSHLESDPPVSTADPLVVLIPKRHVETWIRNALGQSVNQDDDYKKPVLKKDEFRVAAKQIYDWARDTPVPGQKVVPSLLQSLPEWRKIG
jgi:hypothetical protein